MCVKIDVKNVNLRKNPRYEKMYFICVIVVSYGMLF